MLYALKHMCFLMILIVQISLFPKKKLLEMVANFCPISLCNVIYKLIAKAIANRLKRMLPCIILDSQSTFIPRRLVTDNVLVTYELIHFLRQKRMRKTGYASLKLDISKAYNRVE